MVADELAVRLVDCFVRAGDTVGDPFCGSGRLLAAAARMPGKRIGIDINPLACLLTRAKLTHPDVTILQRIAEKIDSVRSGPARSAIGLREPREVQAMVPLVCSC